MGDIGFFFGGLSGKSKADFENGNSKYVSYLNIYRNIAVDQSLEDLVQIDIEERQNKLQFGDVLFTGSSEGPEDVGLSAVITSEPTEPLFLNSFCFGFRLQDRDTLDPNFTKHLFRSHNLRRQIVKTASGVTRFNVSKAKMAKVRVPIPSIEVQRELSKLLDKFDVLVNDISSGLPAEIAARRKQYEYYRDKLLTFPEAAA